MENFRFQTINSLTNSVSTSSPLHKDLIEQINQIYTLSQIEFSDDQLHIDVPAIRNNVQSSIFHRRISILDQIKDSENIDKVSSNGKAYDESLEKLDTVAQFIQEKQNFEENRGQFVQQNMKRSMKRSQTSIRNQLTTGQRPQRYKVFLKKTNSAITNNFEQIRRRKSFFTSKLRDNVKQYLKTIQVKYFGTNIAKVLFIEREMSAIEFTVLALKEFAQDQKLDQSLYEYKNCTLAYQLETLEEQMELEEEAFRRPLLRTKSFKSEEDKLKSRMGSYEERIITSQIDFSSVDLEDKTITIDYHAQLGCKQVELVLNQQFHQTFGIDLNRIKQEQENYPNDILIIVEEGKTLFYIRCQKTEFLKIVFEQVSQILSSDINLRLKYPCIHYGIEPLHHAIPIAQLPIHWLTIERKYINIIKPLSSVALSNKLSTHNQQYLDDKLFGSYISSKDQNGVDPKILHQQVYTYEEYKVIMKKQNKQWYVTIGIDYFDITIQYHNQQDNTTKNLFNIIKILLSYLIENDKKNIKQISMNQLVSAALDESKNQFFVTYLNQMGKTKVLTFQSMPYIDRVAMIINKKQLNDACTKLLRLLKLKKNNKTQSNNNY